MSRYTPEQSQAMFDALQIAYGLTCGMVDDLTNAGQHLNAADLTCVRRHVLDALREAGLGAS